ncbi:MAG: HAD family hydrolase [Desulfuromonas sp.]|nr:HAD family hydrolase [Desulfuromonas sp.]
MKQHLPYTSVLFDLDGTLLDVDMHRFVPMYLNCLAQSIAVDIDSERFVRVMIECTMERLRSDDGSQTNEEFFLAVAQRDLQISAEQFLQGLQTFYREHMDKLQPLITSSPMARQLICMCKRLGLEVIIATNPVFPRPLVDARLKWGGIGDCDYLLVTSSENSRYCKPNPNYFSAILTEIGREAHTCLMVGNDTEQDLSAAEVGITTFLVDTWMIDRGSPFVPDHRGSHIDLYNFIDQLTAGGA